MDVPNNTMITPMNKPATHPNAPPENLFQKAPATAPTIPSPIMTTHRHILKFPTFGSVNSHTRRGILPLIRVAIMPPPLKHDSEIKAISSGKRHGTP